MTHVSRGCKGASPNSPRSWSPSAKGRHKKPPRTTQQTFSERFCHCWLAKTRSLWENWRKGVASVGLSSLKSRWIKHKRLKRRKSAQRTHPHCANVLIQTEQSNYGCRAISPPLIL